AANATEHTQSLGARQSEIESRAVAQLRFDPDAAAVRLDDLLGDGQTSAGSFIFFRQVQTAEYAEDLLVIARLDANAVVADVERDAAGVFGRRTFCRFAVAPLCRRPLDARTRQVRGSGLAHADDNFGLRIIVVLQAVTHQVGQ